MRVSGNSTMTEAQGKIFGNEMRRLRKNAGLTVKGFAEYVGISATYVTNLELGYKKPSPQLAERIADTFDLTVSDMLIPHIEREIAEREKFGKVLAKHRAEKGYSSALVAGALGIPTSVYKEYEQGTCSITERNIATLNKLLGIGEEKPKEVEAVVKEVVEVKEDVPTEICDIILGHVTDLNVDKDTQKKVWHYFSTVKLNAEERRLFG